MLVLLGEQYTEGSYVGIIRLEQYEQHTEGCYVGIIMWTVYRGFLCWYY